MKAKSRIIDYDKNDGSNQNADKMLLVSTQFINLVPRRKLLPRWHSWSSSVLESRSLQSYATDRFTVKRSAADVNVTCSKKISLENKCFVSQ